jgi:hypothetical protein
LVTFTLKVAVAAEATNFIKELFSIDPQKAASNSGQMYGGE